ncbi:MAG: hypothetical protein KAV00_17505 [Phycisphaerae bacterium]|nr:hypothetical protein [Phycisphaerae bacterium]
MISYARKNETHGMFALMMMLAISLTGCVEANNSVELIQEGETIWVFGDPKVVIPSCGLPGLMYHDSQKVVVGGSFHRNEFSAFVSRISQIASERKRELVVVRVKVLASKERVESEDSDEFYAKQLSVLRQVWPFRHCDGYLVILWEFQVPESTSWSKLQQQDLTPKQCPMIQIIVVPTGNSEIHRK